MLICPVCRSQNMDTAKFCGNCGNSFPRPSMPTSSLINCPQGHVYSAVYQFCPYCPQPEAMPNSGPPSDFATRIEDPITAIEPSAPQVAASPMEFSQRGEAYSTNFETRIGSAEAFETRLSEIELSDILEPAAAPVSPINELTNRSAPTEIIAHLAETTIAEMPAIQFDPLETQASAPAVFQAPVQPPPQAPPPPAVAPPQPIQTMVSESLPNSASAAPALAAPDMDRRTIVVAEEASPQHSSKGKIVGWLISYNRNPDGEDYRLYAGYNRIGANPVCDIVLEDETVSGSHSIIVYREGRFLVKDDLSRNGTFVNGREISEAHPLQSYDQVRVGNTYLTFISAQRIA